MTYKSLYEFKITKETEVDKTTVREEEGKTISETTKVKEKTPIWFSIKSPSRIERELAEEERAAWWSRYVEKGILPAALLLKTYANYGGILSKEDAAYYYTLQQELLSIERKSSQIAINEKDKIDELADLDKRFIDVRKLILDFEEKQAVFFDNTAEAKARFKMIHYMVLHLSNYKTDENKDWEAFFKGTTTEEKLAYQDKLIESSDEIYSKSYPILELVAGLYAAGGGFNKDSLDQYLKTFQGVE